MPQMLWRTAEDASALPCVNNLYPTKGLCPEDSLCPCRRRGHRMANAAIKEFAVEEVGRQFKRCRHRSYPKEDSLCP